MAQKIKTHWQGVMNAATSGVNNNARAEGFDSRIQCIERLACRDRNRDRFRNAIFFHLAGLDLYP